MNSRVICKLILAVVLVLPVSVSGKDRKIPVVVITDLYHPYQDPGDNMDLITGYGLPDVELKAVLLDITDSFRKEIADHPTLWKDPRGPREGGIIPVEQMNYIFSRRVPYAFGPLEMMASEEDKMETLPEFENGAIQLLLEILAESKEKVEVLSFGSARILAVAYNRNPSLLKRKIHKVHLSAGTASPAYELGSDAGANSIPGGEWNVALDVHAFNRILKSDLPVAIYPCAGKDGGFVKSENNTYWQLPDMSFTEKMHPQLRRYLDYAFMCRLQYDFLKAMDSDYPTEINTGAYPSPFHVWESAIWLNATGRIIVRKPDGNYMLVRNTAVGQGYELVSNGLRPCRLTEVREDGRFSYVYTEKPCNNKEIYYRENPAENEKALQQIIPDLYISFKPN